MNKLASNNNDNVGSSNAENGVNSPDNQSAQPALSNQDLANKIYPTARTGVFTDNNKNTSNTNENEDNSDSELITRGVKDGLGIVLKVVLSIFAFLVISPLLFGAIVWLLFVMFPSTSSNGSKNY